MSNKLEPLSGELKKRTNWYPGFMCNEIQNSMEKTKKKQNKAEKGFKFKLEIYSMAHHIRPSPPNRTGTEPDGKEGCGEAVWQCYRGMALVRHPEGNNNETCEVFT